MGLGLDVTGPGSFLWKPISLAGVASGMNFSCFAAGMKDYWNSQLVAGKPMDSMSSCQTGLSFLLTFSCCPHCIQATLWDKCLPLILLCKTIGSPHLPVFFVVVEGLWVD